MIPTALLTSITFLCLMAMGFVPIADDEIVRLPEAQEVSLAALVDDLAGKHVVLLGESHDNPAHHRMQQTVIQELHLRRPDMAVAMEMFPRTLQPVLDQWIAGALTEAQFLDAVAWYFTWGFDAALYLPILRDLRDRHIPLLAMNLRREVVRQVSMGGIASLKAEVRAALPPLAPASEAYLDALKTVFQSHPSMEGHGATFEHFVQAQQVWDGVMAEHLTAWLATHPEGLVVGLVGSGHVLRGHGIPWQLQQRETSPGAGFRVASLLPWVGSEEWLPSDVADYAWGTPEAPQTPPPVRLGVLLGDEQGKGVPIQKVLANSPAAMAGLQAGDRILRLDGHAVPSRHALVRLVRALSWESRADLEWQRDGVTMTQRVTLPKAPVEKAL